MSIRLPTVSPGVQVQQATPYVCCVVLFVGSRSFSERFLLGDSGFPLKYLSVMGCGNGWEGYLALHLRVPFAPIPIGQDCAQQSW